MSLYLDTNVLVPLHVREPNSDLLNDWFAARLETLFVSDLAAGEFGATISRLVRMSELGSGAALAILSDFDDWRASVSRHASNEAVDVMAAAVLVRQPRPKLLMADAIHLATCRRLGLTLVTFDGDLATLAAAHEVQVLVPQ